MEKNGRKITIVRPDGTEITLPDRPGREHIVLQKQDEAPPEQAPDTRVEAEPIRTAAGPVDGAEVRLREENVQEILTQVPHWMIRWGNALLLGILVGVVLMAGVIRTPDVVSAAARVQRVGVPQAFAVAPTAEVLVRSGETVGPGTPLFTRGTRAVFADVRRLRELLDTLRLNSRGIHFPLEELPVFYLGRLQEPYQEFVRHYLRYRNTGPPTAADYSADRAATYHATTASLLELRTAIETWYEQHVVTSSLAGRVSLAGGDQSRELTVTPSAAPEWQASVAVPAARSGGIAPGQEVIIALDRFPSADFGTVNGVVRSVQTARDTAGEENTYLVTVPLPPTLKTSFGTTLSAEAPLRGTAEIITRRTTLLRRIFSRRGTG